MGVILLLNGPNLNLLGTRSPEIYGTQTLADVEAAFESHAAAKGVQADCFQSNHEGVLIDVIQDAPGTYDGIVYNPGAHAHYSYALRDAIASIDVPVVEVHISNIYEREAFRHVDVIEPVCQTSIVGKGIEGYLLALDALLEESTKG